jgi:uncharacterized glyoxalase superfamily protein PhnB
MLSLGQEVSPMPKLQRPAGHHTITPSFIAAELPKVIEFAERAFGAELVDRYQAPDGAIVHAELMINGSVVMCASSAKAPTDEFFGHRSASVQDLAGNRWTINAVIEEVSHDEAHRRMAELMKDG